MLNPSVPAVSKENSAPIVTPAMPIPKTTNEQNEDVIQTQSGWIIYSKIETHGPFKIFRKYAYLTDDVTKKISIPNLIIGIIP